MNMLHGRFRKKIESDLANHNELDYFIHFSRLMSDSGADLTLLSDHEKSDKKPDGKTIGEIHGLKGYYYIIVKVGNSEDRTEKCYNISEAILKSFDLACKLKTEGQNDKR